MEWGEDPVEFDGFQLAWLAQPRTGGALSQTFIGYGK